MVKQRTPYPQRLIIRKQVFTCPHCGERISMLLDLSAGFQRYIEDCEVCCNPIEIRYQAEEGALVLFQPGFREWDSCGVRQDFLIFSTDIPT